MTNQKMIISGIYLGLVIMLFSSGSALTIALAQTNSRAQTNNGGGENKSNKQNYDNFQNCLDNIAGTTGFATIPQIRECFIASYNIHDDDDDDDDDLFED
ncbi:hypothetical protein [Candidatus Nitrosocosmicus sp. SS]|uniref:hypothetical protein n=1 Tax=Candidatus Nitrosocosmicus agrestis TaxID=2563600 RepID=UPI00122DC770|nr:hypothetical protein [Candidatus Nitrosocosmicus sp. SS]KAA2281377.1 hypothetical protein F1Z66_08305 [Candidatus Nitrosocosmicus sp. SS]KAF0867733.1 hypothetical protein E5N71_13885 [Candidatus Nitrosocosmicus sp. SS]